MNKMPSNNVRLAGYIHKASFSSEVDRQAALACLATNDNHQCNAYRLEMLRKMCGYIEDGSGDSVSISQDECTRTWCLTIGYDSISRKAKHYYGDSFNAAIDAAIKGKS